MSAAASPGGLEICFLGSGSSGNCAVVRCGDTAVLLDSGLSCRETGKRLAAVGLTLESIRAIFLTHEHSDHIRSACHLSAKLGVPVYATRGTAMAAGFPGPLFLDARRVADGTELALGPLFVRVTATPHDGTESVCFVFSDGDGRRIGVATDLGHLSAAVLEALTDCEVLGLEANYDDDLLRVGPYPAYLKRRIFSDVGHLSNDSAAHGLYTLVGPRTTSVVALHVSRHNNTTALADRSFGSVIAEMGATAGLCVAAHDAPTAWKRA